MLSAKNKKVLIVDDEVDFGILMTTFFVKKGYQACSATSIYEGMKMLEEQRPDYIFLDNNLPDGLGWGNAKMVIEKYPQTRLILMSALQVPTTSSSLFSILYKPNVVVELEKMFP
jgi:DNA-binding response OmpR family regulator